MVYDTYRGNVLLFSGLWRSPFAYKLRRVDWEGSANVLGNCVSFVQALSPRGDGIVNFQQSSSNKVQYLDANNAAHDVVDAAIGLPFSWNGHHVIHHPPMNSLVGASNSHDAAVRCRGLYSLHVYRVPLSTDGAQVLGAISCSAQEVGSGPAAAGFSHMYGGGLMDCSAVGGGPDGCILSSDPITLALAKWANPDVRYFPIQGGVFSRRIGKAILLDAGGIVLRTYAHGQTSAGTVRPTDAVVDDRTSGWGATGVPQ